MGLLLTLRTDPNRSYFKDILIEMIERYCPDEILMSSGYFGEFDTNPPAIGLQSSEFYASADEGSNGKRLSTVLQNDRRLETVRLVGSEDWSQKGRNNPRSFVQQLTNLRDNLRMSMPGKQIIAYDSLSGHWHAKVTILLCCGRAVAGAVGSSNYTGPAFGAVTQARSNPYFNFESDTFIYDPELNHRMTDIVSGLQDDDYAPGFVIGNVDSDQDEAAILLEHYNRIIATINDSALFRIIP